MTGNHHKRKKHNQKKNVAHFSALQIAHKSSGREKGRQRKRQSKSTRAFLTSLFRKNRTKSTSRKKNKHNKEEESSREGRTSRKIQEKKMRKIPRHSRQRGMRRVASGQLRLVLRSEVARQLYLLCWHFPLFPAFRFGFLLHQRCLCCCGRDCNCDCSSARVGGNYAMPTLQSCHRTSWPGRRQQSQAGSGHSRIFRTPKLLQFFGR